MSKYEKIFEGCNTEADYLAAMLVDTCSDVDALKTDARELSLVAHFAHEILRKNGLDKTPAWTGGPAIGSLLFRASHDLLIGEDLLNAPCVRNDCPNASVKGAENE